MINQSAEKLAISMMFREHLAELKDWYREDDSNSKITEIKGYSWRSETNENRRVNISWKKL